MRLHLAPRFSVGSWRSKLRVSRLTAANLAAVRRLVVSMLRQDTTVKRGAKCKRMKCALDPQYLLHVLHNATFDA